MNSSTKNFPLANQQPLPKGSYTPGSGSNEPLRFVEYVIPRRGSGGDDGIAAGPDGNVWFTDADINEVGKVTTIGTISEFPVPTASSYPEYIAAGPDGNLWFTQFFKVGRITTGGTITEFASVNYPVSITAAADGNLWFTEQASPSSHRSGTGRITPNGSMTELVINTRDEFPFDITAGSDGNLWVTDAEGNIGKFFAHGL